MRPSARGYENRYRTSRLFKCAGQVTFAAGITGFEACKSFQLLHEPGKATVFWLQSLDDMELMFPVAAPKALDIVCQIELTDGDCALIALHDSDEVAVMMIVLRKEAENGKLQPVAAYR